MHIRSERGSITFLGLLFALFIVSSTLIHLYTLSQLHIKTRNKIKIYLCFKRQIKLTKNYLSKMGKLNKLISYSYKASFIPATSAISKVTHKSLIISQRIFHASVLKNISLLKDCPFTSRVNHLRSLPYQRRLGIFLKRHLDGTAKLRTHRWKMKTSHSILNFYLQVDMKVKNRFSNSLFATKTKEVRKRVKPYLNGWSGFHFY
jgi:hypothetical protein